MFSYFFTFMVKLNLIKVIIRWCIDELSMLVLPK